METKIQELCLKLLATDDPQTMQEISRELQAAIHQHIEELRRKLLEVPAFLPDTPSKPQSRA